jgi:uncharacterized membrane protein YbaN (DUF454 family)
VLSRPSRYALIAVGWTSVGVGVLGMVLPVLPTTCFLLLAGACFARSSPRAARWLHTNRLFGRYLRDYRESKVIPMHVKALSLTVLWATIGATVFAVSSWFVRIPVLLIAVIITVHVARTASRRIDPSSCVVPDTSAQTG